MFSTVRLRLPALSLAFAALLIRIFAPHSVLAQSTDGAALNIYNENPWRQLPLKEIRSHTVIAGPVAKTQIAYVVENKNTERSEVGLNFHVPLDTVLTASGYYYRAASFTARCMTPMKPGKSTLPSPVGAATPAL